MSLDSSTKKASEHLTVVSCLDEANHAAHGMKPLDSTQRQMDGYRSSAGGHYWEIENKDIVVIPSHTFDHSELSAIPGIAHYEERMLYTLLALTHQRTRITFITSIPLDPAVLEYYLSLIPTVKYQDIRDRLLMLSVCNTDTSQSLAEKILDRPKLLHRIKQMVNPATSVLVVCRGTELENKISQELGIPLYSAKQEQQFWGTKAGSRTLFQKCDIPTCDGTYDACKNVDDFISSIIQVAKRNLAEPRGVVKLTDGFSGKGNAIIHLKQITECLKKGGAETEENAEEVRQATVHALETMEFCHHGRHWKEFSKKIEDMGAIFELYIHGKHPNAKITSPSVQVVVNEDYSVTVLSTHEQLLEGQLYMGCVFPAREDYAAQLVEYGRRVGIFLAERNVQDHFSVDFMCVQEPDSTEWSIYAVEINLRTTATTHPWMTMKLLTHGSTDETTGLFMSNSSNASKENRADQPSSTSSSQSSIAKYYVASDNVSHDGFNKLLPLDLIEMIQAAPEINWSAERQTGVVFHMIGCLPDNGKIGLTAIGNSPQEAQELFDKTVDLLVKETAKNPLIEKSRL